MNRNLSLSALALAASLALAGCGAAESGSIPAPDQPAASSSASEAAAEHNGDDVMFAQMMIPHHQQAVEMSDLMLAKPDIDPAIAELATQIKEAQAPEIDTMTGWLEAWGEPLEASEGTEGHDMGSDSMNGMMSSDQMTELESAEGTEASEMFLTQMTAHHEGAVEMAQQEIENGAYPDAIVLAEMIVETQQAEIEEMNTLLQGL
ncbi:DUF305 domain-containing protein [Arthrobacter sp. H5]|uniref:DUF305 domain-containing protein n=1 Tax=Arthrobacter sp. H5 TaxID=1267973 RepID=UPI0004878811|nr:DUF305 domain-containing protein [Arthrobacter sp. H5]